VLKFKLVTTGIKMNDFLIGLRIFAISIVVPMLCFKVVDLDHDIKALKSRLQTIESSK
jgi:hypothetical protein